MRYCSRYCFIFITVRTIDFWHWFLTDEESGSEEETLQYFSTVDPNYRSRRKKKLDSQNKNSQSFLSVLLSVNHGLMAVFTEVKVRIYKCKVFQVYLVSNLPHLYKRHLIQGVWGCFPLGEDQSVTADRKTALYGPSLGKNAGSAP